MRAQQSGTLLLPPTQPLGNSVRTRTRWSRAAQIPSSHQRRPTKLVPSRSAGFLRGSEMSSYQGLSTLRVSSRSTGFYSGQDSPRWRGCPAPPVSPLGKPRAIPADSREVARLGLNSWPDVRYIGGATHPLDTGNHCHGSQSRLPAQACSTPRKVSPRLAGFRVESDSSGYRGYPTRLVSPRLTDCRVESAFPGYRCCPTREGIAPLNWFPLRSSDSSL